MDEAVQGTCASGRTRRLRKLRQSQMHPKFTFSKLFWKQKADRCPYVCLEAGQGRLSRPARERRQATAVQKLRALSQAGFMGWRPRGQRVGSCRGGRSETQAPGWGGRKQAATEGQWSGSEGWGTRDKEGEKQTRRAVLTH